MSAIKAQGLGIGYHGEVIVVDIDLTVPAGGSLALVGTNGSGKSTFIRTLVGLTPTVTGRLDVREITTSDPSSAVTLRISGKVWGPFQGEQAVEPSYTLAQ